MAATEALAGTGTEALATAGLVAVLVSEAMGSEAAASEEDAVSKKRTLKSLLKHKGRPTTTAPSPLRERRTSPDVSRATGTEALATAVLVAALESEALASVAASTPATVATEACMAATEALAGTVTGTEALATAGLVAVCALQFRICMKISLHNTFVASTLPFAVFVSADPPPFRRPPVWLVSENDPLNTGEREMIAGQSGRPPLQKALRRVQLLKIKGLDVPTALFLLNFNAWDVEKTLGKEKPAPPVSAPAAPAAPATPEEMEILEEVLEEMEILEEVLEEGKELEAAPLPVPSGPPYLGPLGGSSTATVAIGFQDEDMPLDLFAKRRSTEGKGVKFSSAVEQAIKNFRQLSKQNKKEQTGLAAGQQVSSSSSSSSSGPAKQAEVSSAPTTTGGRGRASAAPTLTSAGPTSMTTMEPPPDLTASAAPRVRATTGGQAPQDHRASNCLST
uniref:Uncharacterized protein n=1 Tax=Chromera velia CCMP2878 TaxID=1169474 RepID=A0A0G4HJK0_9ALVE|eukprot:Cvel_7107.t1-p1 / transcript=Cvel_7107.t1 / gene=Cvel_7107 / organism=Chromera_velia_CCMP2878 / gene_product=hypothetical protein / transcript_product=hypothetical protein / location=Cvel_scaffold364:23212-26582(-) / protein_length=450 / sequence_SO=supercontig / SO=protein_coding / is_pseudo=false